MFSLIVHFSKLDEAYYQPEANEVIASNSGFAEGNTNGSHVLCSISYGRVDNRIILVGRSSCFWRLSLSLLPVCHCGNSGKDSSLILLFYICLIKVGSSGEALW